MMRATHPLGRVLWSGTIQAALILFTKAVDRSGWVYEQQVWWLNCKHPST